MNSSPLIIALDLESAADARSLVRALGESTSFYKVGLELYTAAGMDFVRELIAEGKQVFVDLKLYDISETVKRATALVARSGATFLTVHAQDQVVRAAVAGKGDSELGILAVTVLTSFDQNDIQRDGYAEPLSAVVDRRARTAVKAGAEGIVCSALDVARVRQIAGPEITLVTPGVRSAGAGNGDQKRVATPAEAIRNGADYLVIGRQVTLAADPNAEVERILDEIVRETATA